MIKLKYLHILIILFLVNVGHALEDSVVAIVNDQVILQSELDERLENIDIQKLNRIQQTKLKNDALNQLIEESLLDQASTRMGIRVSDIDLQNQIKLIAENQGLTVLQLKDEIERQNIGYIKYLDNLRRNIKRQELFRVQFTNRAYISNEEIASFLKSNQVPEVQSKIDIKEYIIDNQSNTLNLSQAKIILDGMKEVGLEENKKKYPNYNIQVTSLNDTQLHELPDIYQNNLQVLDKDKFSNVFETGKGYTMLEVMDSDILVDEYKVSHILMKTNPMEDNEEIKEKLYEIKNNVLDGADFSEYAQKFSFDKASAIKGGSLGWITEKLVVDKFRSVMMNTPVGGLSEPFKTQFGWHILYLEEKRVKNITDKIKRNQAISILKDRKVAVAKKEWLAKLKDQAYIEYIK